MTSKRFSISEFGRKQRKLFKKSKEFKQFFKNKINYMRTCKIRFNSREEMWIFRLEMNCSMADVSTRAFPEVLANFLRMTQYKNRELSKRITTARHPTRRTVMKKEVQEIELRRSARDFVVSHWQIKWRTKSLKSCVKWTDMNIIYKMVYSKGSSPTRQNTFIWKASKVQVHKLSSKNWIVRRDSLRMENSSIHGINNEFNGRTCLILGSA